MQLYDSSFKRKKMILICIENQYVMIFIEKSQKKTSKKFVGLKKTPTFATAIKRESNERKT